MTSTPAPGTPDVPDGWGPDREEARRLLREELAGPEYAQAEPHPVLEWLDGLLARFTEWLDSLGGGVPAFPGWVLLVVIVLMALAVLLAVRPRANPSGRARGTAPVLEDRSLTPGDHRRAAATAQAAGDHGAALAGWFRALVRQAEVRTVLDTRPGRTATEAAHALAAVFPAEQRLLHEAADRFNAVVYGDRAVTAAQAESVRLLDSRLQQASPAAVRDPGADTGLVAPR